MIQKRDGAVSKEHFRKHFDKVVKAARDGNGPIAITEDSEVLGFLVGPEMYERLYAEEIKTLLKKRLKEKKTISAQEVRRRISAIIDKHRSK